MCAPPPGSPAHLQPSLGRKRKSSQHEAAAAGGRREEEEEDWGDARPSKGAGRDRGGSAQAKRQKSASKQEAAEPAGGAQCVLPCCDCIAGSC